MGINERGREMIDMNFLSPDEARAVFDEWMAEQSKDFVDPKNARFQIVFNKVSEDRDIIMGIML